VNSLLWILVTEFKSSERARTWQKGKYFAIPNVMNQGINLKKKNLSKENSKSNLLNHQFLNFSFRNKNWLFHICICMFISVYLHVHKHMCLCVYMHAFVNDHVYAHVSICQRPR
jgi:hypothetical protein